MIRYDGMNKSNYCETRNFRAPFISWVSRPWQIRENNGPRIFER